MKNGLKIIRKTEQATKAVFIPEETIEQAQFNTKIQWNIDAKRKAEADEQARKAALARQEAAHAARIRKTLRSCAAMTAVGTAAWLCR